MSTVDQLHQLFREALDMEVSSSHTDIIDSGLLDSLALVTLLAELEQQFSVTVPLEALDVDSLRTIEQIAALVDRLQRQSGQTELRAHEA